MSSELGQLMQEPAGGANGGRRASDTPAVEGRHLPLGVTEGQAAEFMRSSGWSVVEAHRGRERGGAMVAHRGVLHEHEYVDTAAVEGMLERELGYDLEQLHSVYSTGGRIPSTRRELRDRIDARVLALSRSGANMDLFGRVTGLNPSTLDRALARAQAKEGN